MVGEIRLLRMTMRVSVLFATLGLLGAQQLPPDVPQPAQGDAVTTFLENLRGPAVRRMNLDAWFVSANISLSGKRYSEAEGIFRSLMVEDALDARGLEGVARVYLAQDRKDDAIGFLQAAVGKSPSRHDILFALVRTAVEVKEFDLALTALERALAGLADVKRRGEVYSRIGELYALKSDLSPSIAAFRKAKELLPGDRHVTIELAQALEASGQNVEAVETYRAVVGVDPRDGAALVQRASEVSEGGGDLEVAAIAAELARKLLPEDLRVADTLGWIYIKQNKPKTVIPMYEELVTKAPESSTYHYHFAMALLQAGDTTAGLSELQTALRWNPPDAERESIQRMVTSGGLRK
jgi:tetratricopeptide (TPR) repeat protein